MSLPQLHLQNLTSYRHSADEGRLAAPRALDSSQVRVDSSERGDSGKREPADSATQVPHGSRTLPAEGSVETPVMMQRSFTHPLRSFDSMGRSSGLPSLARLSHRSSAGAARPAIPARQRPTVVISTREGTAEWRKQSSDSRTVVTLGTHAETAVISGEPIQRVRIVDSAQVFDKLNNRLGVTGQCVVTWPNEEWMKFGGKAGWDSWKPENGMEASVVHRWTPSNPDPTKRSHIGQTILLLQVDTNRFVPISESGVSVIGDEV